MNREQILKARDHYSEVIGMVEKMEDMNLIKWCLISRSMNSGLCIYFMDQVSYEAKDWLAIKKPDNAKCGYWWTTPRLASSEGKEAVITALTVRRDFLTQLADKMKEEI